ncbi:V-type immunoglobulin domain-containing suppressor of T-cell activation [Pristis pectinata]|uniref:V-type immunoglobulin domain-containing suppressor of T-cell activation n=1 Tax=Pristis pectinata TaxID=685728 RepID=UPI00223E4BFB|nr:V-type immunoglobulin domain-containing suppressor of T-cell activation [Pristis pectinata]
MDVQKRISSQLQAWTVILLLGTVTKGQAVELKVSSDHTVYTCPEGLNVTFKCSLSGHLKDRHDFLAKFWYFSHSKNDTCAEKIHIRNTSFRRDNHHQHKAQGVYMNSDHRGTFWVTLTRLVQDDQGIYCCVVHELHRLPENKPHSKIELTVYGTMELKVVRANGTQSSNQECTFQDAVGESDSEATTAIALATLGCVITILSLPLILLLIYKQRQETVTRRRAHELVRMDSEAVGVENPVFEEIPVQNPEMKPRAPAISSRIQSESGQHLLSEPNTPLSPEPMPRFFPVLELVPDSPK